jgi:hypothetical protein
MVTSHRPSPKAIDLLGWIFAGRQGALVNVLMLAVAWCILLVIAWPLALLVLLAPVIWLLALPFRIVGVFVRAVLALLRQLLFLPARLLGYRG